MGLYPVHCLMLTRIVLFSPKEAKTTAGAYEELQHNSIFASIQQ